MPGGTITALLVERLRGAPPAPAWEDAPGGGFRAVPWDESRRNVLRQAEALRRRLAVGDRVAILASVRRAWVESDFANLLARTPTVGIYPTETPEGVGHVLAHSGARVLIADDAAAVERIAGSLPGSVETVVTMEGPAAELPGRGSLTMDALRADGENVDESALFAFAGETRPDDLLTLVYTSGTTGRPKGAILRHRNLVAVTDAIASIFPLREGDRGLVYLPLAHILQRYALYQGLRFAGTPYYTARLTELGDVLKEARPHILAAVPRVLEKVKARIDARVAAMPARRQRIVRWAVRVGGERAQATRPSLWLRLRHRLADRLVLQRIREGLGGGVRFIVSGAAPLEPELARFFFAIGIPVYEGYGLTETSAPATANTPSASRLGTVGRAIPGLSLRIGEDGEICMKGPGVFEGYWQDAEATAAAFDADGYFKSGDLGSIDADGFLSITGRKKELIINSAGKNIAPAPIEAMLTQHPLVGQAYVHGDKRKFLVALLALDPDDAPAWAAERGLTGELASAVRQELQAHVDAVNGKVARYETIKRFAVLSEPFTPEAGTVTATMKLRRDRIAAAYADTLAKLHDDG